MTRKHGLSGLPTLAFFDAKGAKLDEISGYLPESKPYLAMMTKHAKGGVAPAVATNEERIDRILRRFDRELEESEGRLRSDIRGIVKSAFQKKDAPKAKPLEEQIDEFAAKIKEDGDLHSRLKKFLGTPRGKEFVRNQLQEQGFDGLEPAVELYFEKNQDGTYSILPGYDEQLRGYLDQLETPEEPRPYLGISPDDFSDDQRKELGLEKGHGIKILEIVPGGPAAQAGIKPGDILLSIGGKKVGDENIESVLGTLRAGDQLEAVVLRGKEKQKLKLTLGEKRE